MSAVWYSTVMIGGHAFTLPKFEIVFANVELVTLDTSEKQNPTDNLIPGIKSAFEELSSLTDHNKKRKHR